MSVWGSSSESSDEDEQISTGTKVLGTSNSNSKRKSYDINYKLEAISYAKSHSINSAAILYKVDRKCVRDWLNKEYLLKESSQKSNLTNPGKRLKGAGRPIADKDFDEQLYTWIINQRLKKIRISRRMIKNKAMAIKPGFKGSNGWLQRFLKRRNLVCRQSTTTCQKPPEAYQEKVADFILFVSDLRKKNKYQHIFACDETGLFVEATNKRSIAVKGSKEVPVLIGNDKFRITVMLTAREDGYKCRPFVLINRKRPVKDIDGMFKGKLSLCWKGSNWMNDDCIEEYLDKIIGASLFGRRLIVWDSFRAHLSERTKKKLKELGVDSAVIPGGTTKFIQAPDVMWNAPFKAKIKEYYEDWVIHGEKLYTKMGNLRGPAMETYLKGTVREFFCVKRGD